MNPELKACFYVMGCVAAIIITVVVCHAIFRSLPS